MERWIRAKYLPGLPLGKDGRRVRRGGIPVWDAVTACVIRKACRPPRMRGFRFESSAFSG